MLLAVGSRTEALEDVSSDVDILAIYDTAPPDSVNPPSTLDMRSTTGTNWIKSSHGVEINVEAVSIATLTRISDLLSLPVCSHRVPALQELEVRLLNRVRTGTLITSSRVPALVQDLETLRESLHLWRLPIAVAVMNYWGAASYLRLANERRDDPVNCQIALTSAIEGITLCFLALHGQVLYGMKKAVYALRRVDSAREPSYFGTDDLQALLLGEKIEKRLRCAGDLLARIREEVASQDKEESIWREVASGIENADDED